jgi:hypothetical protein
MRSSTPVIQRRRQRQHADRAKAAGSIVRGLTLQIGNELDEFVTSSVRNTLVGLPLDLAAINIARPQRGHPVERGAPAVLRGDP